MADKKETRNIGKASKTGTETTNQPSQPNAKPMPGKNPATAKLISDKPESSQHGKPKSDDKIIDVGITVKKSEDISEWFTQVIQKAEMVDYTAISGCYILRPNSYAIWEKVQAFFDSEIKKLGVKNAYFPLFIPEELFAKESSHVAGFTPEVAWVTHGGNTKLPARIAVRPTSEAIICDSFSRWVRSYRDLPIRLNQWCNVVRWEFKHPTPFLRTREFLWQEGHTVWADKKEAEKEVIVILHLYKRLFEEIYALPVLIGRKAESEKFAGAEYTTSVEMFLPSGKAIQGATSHHLGQFFTKAFDIKFLNVKGESEFAYTNSWGFSTRSIGIPILMHGDDKGLVLPPKIAPVQIAVVPIIFEDSKEKVLLEAQKIVGMLSDYKVELDDREGYTAGFKFNHWELRGVPIRIELGPKDILKSQAVVVRRDTGVKEIVAIKDLTDKIPQLLETIQQDLFIKAKKHLDENIIKTESESGLVDAIKNKKMAFIPWCGKTACSDMLGEKTEGAKSINLPFEQPTPAKCICCGQASTCWTYFAKSY